MRILQINSHYNQGGAGKIVACIHKELKEQGHDSMVAYGRGSNTNIEGIYKIGSKIEVLIDGFVTRLIGINGFTSWNATRKLVNKIEEFCQKRVVFSANESEIMKKYFEVCVSTYMNTLDGKSHDELKFAVQDLTMGCVRVESI